MTLINYGAARFERDEEASARARDHLADLGGIWLDFGSPGAETGEVPRDLMLAIADFIDAGRLRPAPDGR